VPCATSTDVTPKGGVNECPTEHPLGLPVSSIEETQCLAMSAESTRSPLLDKDIDGGSIREREMRLIRFVSLAEQLRLRGSRNYSRYMLLTKGFVAAEGPERRQWLQESAEDSIRDAAWSRRHGRLPGGARILHWRHEGEQRARHLTSADANIWC
jgi:hypothetical protein